MITNCKQLKEYIRADRVRAFGKTNEDFKHRFVFALLRAENWCSFNYLRNLRYYEYYRYRIEHTSGLYHLGYTIPYIMRKIAYFRLSAKYKISIVPNTVGKGLRIPHFNAGVIINCKEMGENCTVSSGVVVGNKSEKFKIATIGDNVELTVGCKIIGDVHIGNNVIVAPNSVVINDVPDNAIVSGVPAKIIKMKSIS